MYDDLARVLAVESDAAKVQQAQTEMLHLLNHREKDKAQRRFLNARKEALVAGELVIVIDFGAHQVKEASAGDNRYADLMFVIYERKGDGAELLWEYFDEKSS